MVKGSVSDFQDFQTIKIFMSFALLPLWLE